MLAALVLALTLSAPTTTTRPTMAHDAVAPISTQHLQVDPNDPAKEPQFVDRYLSFQLSPLASKQTKDGLVVGHILGYIFYLACGSLWGPVVVTKDAEFTGDVALTWCASTLLWHIIASAATLTVIGSLLWLAVPYLSSTATFNELDRQLKTKGLAQGVQKPGGTPPPTPGTPPTPGETPPPSYAY
jgi:hypothetical protein